MGNCREEVTGKEYRGRCRESPTQDDPAPPHCHVGRCLKHYCFDHGHGSASVGNTQCAQPDTGAVAGLRGLVAAQRAV